jgi:hypothetical protein
MDVRRIRERFPDALKDLPPGSSVDDVADRLLFVAMIETGLNELDAGAGVPHDGVRRRFGIDD